MTKHLKRFIAVFMIVIMVAAYMPMAEIDTMFDIQASALVTNGKVELGDNIKWTYDNKSKTITVSGSGAMYNYSNGDDGQRWGETILWQTYSAKKNAKSIVISNGITTIGNNVFNGLNNITSVSIPASVTSIGAGAFAGCSALSSVSIPAKVTSIGNSAFEGCSNLSSVTLNTGLKTIGSSAFKNTKFKSVSLPYTVTSVGSNAFAGVSGLKFTCAYGDAAYNYCKSHSSAYTLKTPVLVADAVLDIANKQVVVTLKLNNAAGLNAANFELTYSNGAVPVSTDTSCGDMSEAITTAVVYNGNGKISVGVVASDCVPFAADTQTITYEIAKIRFKINENEDTADFNLSSKVLMLDNAKMNASAVSKIVDLHEYVEVSERAVAATCVSKGTLVYKCAICGKEKTQETDVNASNHSGNFEVRNAVEATCTSNGYTGDKVCTDCNKTVESGTEIAASGHSHVVTETVAADCTNDGYIKYECSCGDTYTETVQGGTHSYEAQVVDADCTNSGYTIYTCSVCDASYRGDNVPSLGHEYDDKGVCSRCGDVNVTEIVFVENSNMTVNNDTKIVISKTASTKVSDLMKLIDGDGWSVTDTQGNELAEDKLAPTGCILRHSSGAVEYTYVVLGDVNADGKVTAADARLVLRVAASLETLDDVKTYAADVDANTKVVAADARKILRVSSKIDTFK